MSDYSQKISDFKKFYVAKGDLREKDVLLNQARDRSVNKAGPFLLLPFGLHLYQSHIAGNGAGSAQVGQIRMLKFISIIAAAGIGMYYYSEFDRQKEYLHRTFPEMSEYQKNIAREAQRFKEDGLSDKNFQQKKLFSREETSIYRNFYNLGGSKSSFRPADNLGLGFQGDDE